MITVDVKNLSVKFDDFIAVNDISFSVAKSEIFGFLGANGAGKTTTIRVLCGLLQATHGNVKVAGLTVKNQEQAVKSKIGYMSQKFTLYNDLSIIENLDFIAALRKIDRPTYLMRRQELLEFIKFNKSMTTIVQDLPAGVKHQVSLVAALLHDPEIIFLDEPTAGVSPFSRYKFWELIQQLANKGKTVFVTTHFMDEAEQCHRVALMRAGKIAALDSPVNLKAHAFPLAMLEFDPKRPMSYTALLALKQDPTFSYFEPYGRMFHAAITNQEIWQQNQAKFVADFNINIIQPTLEDVFIKTVEHKL